MAEEADDSALYDTPGEFMTSMATVRGVCNGQSVLPDGDHFTCRCSCGWEVLAPTKDEGLRMARIHTGSP